MWYNGRHREIGAEKLKYVLIFCTGGTYHVMSRMRNDHSACVHEGWSRISRKICDTLPLWSEWSMRSRDQKRSRTRPRYTNISKTRLEAGVIKHHQWDMAYGESNYLNDDVAWLWILKGQGRNANILGPNNGLIYSVGSEGLPVGNAS